MKHRILGLIGLVAFLAAAFLAQATTMATTNLAQIVEGTDSAFVGKVTAVEVVETPHGWAERITMEITETIIDSPAKGESVTWDQFRQSEQFRLPGMPVYRVGEEHAIFLSRPGKGSNFRAAYALGQGSFRVARDGKSGAVLLRNEFANENLTHALDIEAVAEAAVETAATKRATPFTAEERAELKKSETIKVASISGGAVTLDAIRDVASTMRSIPEPGKRLTRQGADANTPLTIELDHNH